MIKEVIFDCFGVLVHDSLRAFYQQHATDKTRQALHDLSQLRDKGLLGHEDFINQTADLSKVTADEVRQLLFKPQQPNVDIVQLLPILKQRRMQLGIISNVGESLSNYLPAEVLSQFETITLSYQVGVAKPDRQIFEIHAQRSGVELGAALFIDDRDYNCQAAERYGLATIIYDEAVDIKSLVLSKI